MPEVAREVGTLVLQALSAKEDVPAAIDKYLNDSVGKGTSLDEYMWKQRLANRFKKAVIQPAFVEQIAKQCIALPELQAERV